jgi:predicted outer membrane repeat protein
MKSRKEGLSSSQREANRQALTVITVVGIAGCLLIVALGLSLRAFGPQIYSWTATQVARLTSGAIMYVRADGDGQACDSWANACGLQTALQAAAAGDEIWVQAGIYRPAADTRDPVATFHLKPGVAIYGGFAGTETGRDQRDWETHLTVLSGDLGGDDTTDPDGVVTDPADIVGPNAFHVVTGSGVNPTAILDGFVITAGYASQTPPNIHGYGGGMFNWSGSPTLNNLVFSGNTAGKGAAYYGGGGMFNIRASNPILTHVTFVANTAGSGGGMYNDASSPRLVGVEFIDNRAIDSGGMDNFQNSNPTVEDVTFSGNVATQNSGGMGNSNSSPTLSGVTFANNSAAKNGGGMLNSESSPTMTNITFSGNSAGEFGGGICNTFSSRPTLTTVTIIGNRAPHGSGICNVGGSFTLVNGIVWGNRPAQEQVYNDHVVPSISYSDVEGGFRGTGNLDVDPRLDAFGDYGGLTWVFALRSNSPLIDRGSPSACPATDQLGLSRPVDGDGNGSAICDMGAVEYRSP